MEIHLVRHGRSALVHDGRWFRWAEVPSYEDAYDAAGIRDDWLVEQASNSSSIVAVTHGGFRRVLDARLVMRGWSRTFQKKRYHNWSVWSYRG